MKNGPIITKLLKVFNNFCFSNMITVSSTLCTRDKYPGYLSSSSNFKHFFNLISLGTQPTELRAKGNG